MDSITKRQLKLLVESKNWEVIYKFQAHMVELWNKKELVGENEFQTIRNAIETQSKVEALREFIESIERLAFDQN